MVQGQPQTAAFAAQRLRERGLNARAATDGNAPPTHEPTLVLHTSQRCAAAPDAYGQSLVRADVSVTATLTGVHPEGLHLDSGTPSGTPSGTRSGTTATRHAFGSTATAAAGRAHQRALDAALQSFFPTDETKVFAPARNP